VTAGSLRKLLAQSAIYGTADVFTNVVSFLLLPLFTRFLSPADYGVLGVLLLFSAMAKILFRMGLDGAFFRVHYDQKGETGQRRLAGTVALFAAGAGSLLLGGVVLWAGPLTRLLFSPASPPESWVVLAAADIYLGVFAFIPLNLLRIQDRPGLFSAFSVTRHTLHIGLKVVLVVRGWGVPGILWSNVIATGVFSLALLPILVRHASLRFSPQLLRETLRFGLPKVPHGVMIQVQNLIDRRLLLAFVDLSQVGVYHAGYMIGTAVKFALSAFEPAWQPFVYAQLRKPDAATTLARIVTYAFASFVSVGLGVAVLSRELVQLMTAPEFHAAAGIVPVVTLAYVLHGTFLLTSIGIAIRKKTGYYPFITAIAATCNISANLLLIPRIGMMSDPAYWHDGRRLGHGLVLRSDGGPRAVDLAEALSHAPGVGAPGPRHWSRRGLLSAVAPRTAGFVASAAGEVRDAGLVPGLAAGVGLSSPVRERVARTQAAAPSPAILNKPRVRCHSSSDGSR